MSTLAPFVSTRGDVKVHAGEPLVIALEIHDEADNIVDLTGRIFQMTAYDTASRAALRSVQATAAGFSATLAFTGIQTEGLFLDAKPGLLALELVEQVQGGKEVLLNGGLTVMNRANSTISGTPTVSPGAPLTQVVFSAVSRAVVFSQRGSPGLRASLELFAAGIIPAPTAAAMDEHYSAAAAEQALLSSHYANDDADTDVPGGPVGSRGAKFYAGKAKQAKDGTQPVLDDLALNGGSKLVVIGADLLAGASKIAAVAADLALGGASKVARVAGDLALGASGKIALVATDLALGVTSKVTAVGADLVSGASKVVAVGTDLLLGASSRIVTVATDLALGASGKIKAVADDLLLGAGASFILRAPQSATDAGTAATLAGNYANANTDADISGAPAGWRGARWWNTLAQAAKTAAQTALASFNAQYLGSFATDAAATTAAGGSPATGALYWNSGSTAMKVYQGGVWSLVQAASSADLASSSDTAKGAALIGYRGTNLLAIEDQGRMRRGLSTILRNRQPRPSLATFATATTSARNAATLTYNGSDASNAQLVAKASERNRIVSVSGAGGNPNIVTYTCVLPHGLQTGDRIAIKGCNTSAYNTGGSSHGGTFDIRADPPQINYHDTVTATQTANAGVVVTGPLTFTFSLGSNGTTAADTSTNMWWERSPTFWLPTDPVFTWVTPGRRALAPSGYTQSYYRTTGVLIGAGGTSSPSKMAAVEFLLYEDAFEIFNWRGYGHVYADGVRLNADVLRLDQPTYPGWSTVVQFQNARCRLIRIELFTPCYFWGIATRGRGGIGSSIGTAARRPLALMCGDSFGEPTGAPGGWVNGFPNLLGRRMGWDMIHGSLGSTGMTTNGAYGAGSAYADRMKTAKAAGVEPDIICVLDSLNDTTTPTVSLCTAFVGRLRKLWPGAEIIVLGRLAPTEAAADQTSSIAWIATCKALGIPYVDGGIGALGKPVWITAANKPTFYNGTAATATSAITGDAVTSVTIATGGAGYDTLFGTIVSGSNPTAPVVNSYPAVSFAGGGGTGAAGYATLDNRVTALEIMNGGSDYTTATLTLDHGATATALISGGAVIDIMVTTEGGGFTRPPPVTLSGGGGTGATAVARIEDGRLVGFAVTSAGTGYTSAPTVTLPICSGQATATATITGGVITAVSITSQGTLYTDTPLCKVTGDGFGAEIVPFLSGLVSGVVLTAGGTGYTSAPTVTIAHPTGNDVTHPKGPGHRLIAHRYATELEMLLA